MVTPFATTANWITSGSMVTALRGVGGTINVKGNFATPMYIGRAGDPQVTVTDGKNSIVVRLPLGAIPEQPFGTSTDTEIGGVDSTQPYLVWSIGGASINNSSNSVQASGSVITGTYGFSVNDGSGLLWCDAVTGQPGSENCLGGIQDYELSQISANPNYVIQHMLQWVGDPATMISGTGPIWPLLVIDDSLNNQGPLPQGLTIGIPASVPRPTGQTRGFYALWDNAQQYGWFFYNVGATGNRILLRVYDSQNAYSSLVTDIGNSMNAIVANLCILNYDSSVAGSQYSLASVKGLAPGGVPAFTPPPPLDLSPTGGVNVAPSTFGAWYPSGYNATPTNTTTSVGYTISPAAPVGAVINTAFTFTGSLAGYGSTAPTLTYSVNGAAPIALGGVTATGWSTSITLTVSGAVTITVNDATHGVSGSTNFSVGTGVAPPPPNAVTFSAAAATSNITLSNNGYTATAGGSTTPGSTPQGVRVATAINAAVPVLLEFTFGTISQNAAVGFANSNFAFTNGGGMGFDGNALGFYADSGTGSQPAQTAYLSNNQLTSGNGVASVAGAVITVVVYNNLAFFSDAAMRSTSGVTWNNSTTANPLTGAGGFSLASLGATYYPGFGSVEGGPSVTLNDGTTALSSFAQTYVAANASVKTLSTQGAVTVVKTIVPVTPSGVVAGASFTFTGALNNYSAIPTLVYTVSGSSAVALGGVTLSGWSTTITIAASGNYTITVSDGTVTGVTTSFTVQAAQNTQITAPAQAAAVGYTTLLFNSDFTSANEVAPNGSATSGYNWYWQASTQASDITVSPGLTAAAVNNGNSGGGSFASPAGGILTLNGPNTNTGNVTICSTPQSTQGQGGSNTNPGFGNWAYCYIEIYAQCQPNTSFNNMWFALWADSQQVVNQQYQEVDFFETFCGNFGYPTNYQAFSAHEWNASTGSEPASGGGQYGTSSGGTFKITAIDTNWHLFGFLWVKTGTNTGYVTCYFDNVAQTIYNANGGAPYSSTQIPTGTGGASGWNYLDPCGPLYLKIGGPYGTNGNYNIDYVRVWGNGNTITT